MYIRHIEIGAYRHLHNISLGPLPRPGDASDLVVLAGANGSGKSSVLELISLALSNMYSLTYSLNRTQPQAAFEVTIGLLPSEIDLLRTHAKNHSVNAEALAYLVEHHSYRRSFQYASGEYAKNPTIHNQVHELVLNVLRGSWTRPLGFHLGADRSYQKSPFKRDLLFNYTQYSRHDYVWGYAFQNTVAQYKDMFDFLVTWRYHYTRILGSYYQQRDAGLLADPNQHPPRDEYGAILRRVFPGYEFIDKVEDAPSDLFVRIPSGEIISFSDLSSGEKEVFFTLCFFQRHNVEEAVIVIDEPELHLHPSLVRRLIKTMQELKPRNQIWMATQSPDVIDEAGRDKVAFVRRRTEDRKAELLWAADEESILTSLRDLFGQSGYMGLARAMVFTEGRNASTDRKMLSKLFPFSTKDIKIIPTNGCSEIERINRAVLSILESNLAWCRFFLVRDRDFMDSATVAAMRGRAGDHLFVLERHEVENYLIEFDIIARVSTDLFDKPTTPEAVERDFQRIATELAGDVIRSMVAFRLNMIFRPQDFSVPAIYRKQVGFSTQSGWSAKLTELRASLRERSQKVVSDMRTVIEDHRFDSVFDQCRTEVEAALRGLGWRELFPGKELMDEYCKRKSIGSPPVLQNAILKEMSAHPELVPADLRHVVNSILQATPKE